MLPRQCLGLAPERANQAALDLQMHEVQVGDKARTANGYSDVYVLGHQERCRVSQFRQLRFADGHTFEARALERHFVPVSMAKTCDGPLTGASSVLT